MRPSTRQLTAAHGRCAGEGDGQNGETGWTTPTTAVPQSRSPLRRRCDRGAAGGGHTASLHAPAPTESALGRSRDRGVIFGGGRVPKRLCCAALPAHPRARPIPAGATVGGQSHARHTILRCAKPPPNSSDRRLGASAARQQGATPPKFSAARPHCCRVPTHATEPLGGLPPLITPFRRGGADQESGVAADVHQQKPCPARPPPHRARQ